MEYKIQLDGTYMNVTIFGSGTKNLVIIAGVSLLGLEGLGDTIAQAYSAFDTDYRVFLFDRKKVLPDGYTIAEMMHDTVKCLNILGIEKFFLLGVSHGGMIAMQLCAEYPERVLGAVLASTALNTDEHSRRVIGEWASLCDKNDITGINRAFAKYVYPAYYLEENKELFRKAESMGSEADCKRLGILCKSIFGFDFKNSNKRILCPVLAAGDAQDAIFGENASREIAEYLGGKLLMYDGYGHAVYDLAPDFKDKIRDFFDSI